MGIIKQLDYNTVVRIAAGEVIDRPASVVRELIDNALDAQAGSVRVVVENGGRTYLEVQDDGVGMSPEDLALSIRDHCTSKISRYEDIFEAATLGFRGEALSSITEVADVTLFSRTADTDSGHELQVRFGRGSDLREKAMNQGTTVIVRDLFSELPARAKFLGQDSTELRYIDREIIRKALAFPRVSFEFRSGGRQKYFSSAKNTYLERICDFYPDTLNHLIEVESMNQQYSLQGYISRPAFLRPNRMYQYFFVNGRAVEWKPLGYILQNAYGSLIPRGSFPAVFLYLEIDPSLVDVNVHPMKKEVRFRDETRLSREIQQFITDSLHRDHGISEAEDSILRFTPFESRVAQALEDFSLRQKSPVEAATPVDLFDSPAVPGSYPVQDIASRSESPAPVLQSRDILEYPFKGILFNTYILLEGPDHILFVDQHAAHERINYEKLKTQYRAGSLDSQELLIPQQITVPPQIRDIMEENLDTLAAMGFDVLPFGGNSFQISSIPGYIDYQDAGSVVMGFVESLEQNRDGQPHSTDFIEEAIRQMSCKASVRAGDHLDYSEVKALLSDLLRCSEPFSCPHGRPVMFSLRRYDIERQFKRHGF